MSIVRRRGGATGREGNLLMLTKNMKLRLGKTELRIRYRGREGRWHWGGSIHVAWVAGFGGRLHFVDGMNVERNGIVVYNLFSLTEKVRGLGYREEGGGGLIGVWRRGAGRIGGLGIAEGEPTVCFVGLTAVA